MRAALIALVGALALSACGALGSAAPPEAGPSTGQGLTFDVAVSEKDRAVTLHVGQKLEAVLHARQGMTNWNGVRSSDEKVLVPIVNPGATAARGITLVAFQSLSPGTAQITATAGASCTPGQACPQYVMVLTIDVTVVK